MGILAPDASFSEFCEYVRDIREDVHDEELDDLWEWRSKLLTVKVSTGQGFRSTLPPDEQHLSREERAQKLEQQALSQGRNIERLPEKATF